MRIYSLRVNRTVAGKSFPFDRVYITRYEDRDILDRLFRYALVMPIEEQLMKQLNTVTINQAVARPFNRDDDARLDASEWRDRLGQGEWVLAVPLLPKWMHKNMPQYLTAEKWFDVNARRRRRRASSTSSGVARPSPFESRAYLQTPHKKIRPICVACPRAILHQNGECQLGEAICLESLPLGVNNHFEEGLSLPEATPNQLEPEEYQLTEGEEFVVEEKAPASNSRARDLLRVINE